MMALDQIKSNWKMDYIRLQLLEDNVLQAHCKRIIHEVKEEQELLHDLQD